MKFLKHVHAKLLLLAVTFVFSYPAHTTEQAAIATTKKVCVVGVGYVGLPTALLSAQAGFDVTAYDTDSAKIADLRAGRTVICEQDLAHLLTANLNNPHLKFDSQPLALADFYIIAVPTLFLETKETDVSIVWQAVQTICPLLKQGSSILFASTMPVFLTDAVAQYIQEKTNFIIGTDVFIAYCPEPLLPGNILHELSHNNRIIGGITPECANHAALFYGKFVKGSLSKTNARSAELVKLIENSLRNVQIAFANQIDQMCEIANVDSREIIALANQHPRVNILQPGCGVGGCGMGIDPWVLIKAFPGATQLLLLARTINDDRPLVIIERINKVLKQCVDAHSTKKISVGVWGLTYKPNVSDIRQSPALKIAQHLLNQHNPDVTFSVLEPYCTQELIDALGFTPEQDPQESLTKNDYIIVLVKHDVFKKLSHHALDQKIILDECEFFFDLEHTSKPTAPSLQ